MAKKVLTPAPTGTKTQILLQNILDKLDEVLTSVKEGGEHVYTVHQKTFTQQIVLVTNVATEIPNPAWNRYIVLVNPTAGSTFYFGFSSGLTTSSGIGIDAGQSIKLRIKKNMSVWVVASGTPTVHVFML